MLNKNIFKINKGRSIKQKDKAQVSAPFELLVAVIVMGFVILAGTYALQNLAMNTCLGDKRQDLSELISALKDVTLGSDLTYRNVSFTTKACFNSKYETIKLNSYQDRSKCTAYCGSGDNCMLLEYVYDDPVKGVRKMPIPPICTGLPSYISFAGNYEAECTTSNSTEEDTFDEEVNTSINKSKSTPNWMAINPLANDQNIPSGRYRIFKASASQNNITICFLKEI